MTRGFFKSSQLQSRKARKTGTLAQCRKCGLYKNCKSPNMSPTGRRKLKILYEAEAPAAEEDRKNEQLVGQSGQYLSSIIKSLGMNLNDGLKINAVNCFVNPKKKPTKSQIDCCRPNVLNTIKEFEPHIIIPMGDTAITSLINPKFGEDVGGISKWRGFVIPDRGFNAWICPTFHPSYVNRETTPEVAEKIFKDDLSHAFKMLDTPLPEYTDEKKKIEIIKHPDQAAKWLKDLFRSKIKLVAFDYEGTGLKPQKSNQELKTVSFSWDVDKAVAFPLFKDDFEFMEVFMHFLSTTRIKKICANIKFERDWSIEKIKSPLNGLFFDTMLGAHVLDNRPKITNLTFQAYVNFGIEPYNLHIKKHLQSDNGGGNELNYIDEIDMKNLLTYGGMDSLIEFKLALIQMDILGIDYSHLYDKSNGLDLCPQIKKVFKSNQKVKKRKKKTDDEDQECK